MHYVSPCLGAALCRIVIRLPEMRWTYQIALTTCKRCLLKFERADK